MGGIFIKSRLSASPPLRTLRETARLTSLRNAGNVKSMIVFVAGMPRSGSTFTFNIVRSLLDRRGTLHQIPVESILSALEQSDGADHVVFKGHGADEITRKLVKLGSIKSICSIRKPEDAIASWMTTFSFSIEESISAIEQWILMYQSLREHLLVIPFDSINNDPFAVARRIAEFILTDSSPEEAEEVCHMFTKEKVQEISRRVANREGTIQDIGFSYYDQETFFHRRHVTSLEETKADSRITIDQISLIRSKLSAYCDEFGNLR